MKLRHTDLSLPAEGVWLTARLDHEPAVRGVALVLESVWPPAAPSDSPSDAAPALDVLLAQMQHAGYATFVTTLLTAEENGRGADARFNVPQLANRLLAVLDWIDHQPGLAGLPRGILASDTACGAAIRAAWKSPLTCHAIVCRGGRPDLAGAAPLAALGVPVRLVASAHDPALPSIRQAYDHLSPYLRDWQCLDLADAGFSVPADMSRFADLASEWLLRHLPVPAQSDAQPDHSLPTDGPAPPRDPL